MFDTQSFGWLFDFGVLLFFVVPALAIVALRIIQYRLGLLDSSSKSFVVMDDFAPERGGLRPTYGSLTMVSESTGRPLATPNALVDIDGNPRMPVPY